MTPEQDKEVIDKIIEILEGDTNILDGIAKGTVKIRFGYECMIGHSGEGEIETKENIIRPYLHIN